MRGAVAIFVTLISLWPFIGLQAHTETIISIRQGNELWSFAIQAVGILGIWLGFKYARKLGGWKNALGKTINLFTTGLLLQIIGHNTYFAYAFLSHREPPYPGLPDIGYVGSIACYILAVIALGRALGINYDLKKLRGKVLGLIVFVATFSSPFILTPYSFDWAHPLTIILDFAYPLIEAIFLATCLMVWLSIDKIHYGAVKNKILLVFTALALQYAADTAFFHQAGTGKGFDGDYVDLIFLGAYFLMAVALIQLGTRPADVKVIKEEVSLESAVLIPRAESQPKRNYGLIGAISIFTILLGWWATFYFGSADPTVNNTNIYVSGWFNVYCLLALWGVWCGFKIARKYGGFKNAIGKTISLFTFGLLCQVFGQVTFGFYNNVLNVVIPYPSLADVAYIASPLIYLLALIQVGRAMGINYNLKLIRGKLLSVGFFIALFGFYWIALLNQGYTFDWQQPIKIVLDVSYPFVETLFLAVGVLIYRSYKKENAASVTKGHILFILTALSAQFIADTSFSFLLQSNKWIDSAFGDLPFFVAYFLMTVAIIRLGTTPATTLAKISASQDMDLARTRSKTRFAIGVKIITNAHAEMLSLFGTIRANTKNHSPEAEPHSTTTPRTFP